MEGKIKDEVGDRRPSEVTELNLDNVRASVISGLTNEFSNLVKLSLVNVGLTSLDNFPTLSKLEQIELGDNKLSDGLEHLQGCPLITTVNLVGNRISSIDQLKPLDHVVALCDGEQFVTSTEGEYPQHGGSRQRDCIRPGSYNLKWNNLRDLASVVNSVTLLNICKIRQTESLDLYGCPVTNQPGYRDQLFGLLPNLHLLDGLDKEGKEGQESSDEEEDDYEEDDDDDDEPGLSYLQKDLGDSDESEQDYDPDEEGAAEEDEDEPSDEEEGSGDDEQGQSSSGIKRRKMMPPQEQSDSD